MRILEILMMLTVVICGLWIYVTWILVAYHNWKNGN